MATHITQIDDDAAGITVLRVEGDMLTDDAVLLERIAGCLRSGERKVILDLAELDLMDSESAQVLKRMEDAGQLEIRGIECFLQNAVNRVEGRQ
jgi:anti-anti-sigma regulatory factor